MKECEKNMKEFPSMSSSAHCQRRWEQNKFACSVTGPPYLYSLSAW
jgi:hypothetical protein